MSKFIFVLVLALVTGCSGQARTDYYLAMAKTAEAQAQAESARYEALSQMSKSTDPGASVAAVMALALTRNTTVQPAYIEDEALSYTKALAGPLVSLGALWLQADLSRDLNKNNSKVALAQIDSQTQQQKNWIDGITASSTASYSNGTETPAGLSGDDLAAVLGTLEVLGIAGIEETGLTGRHGTTTTAEVGVFGIATTADVGKHGIDAVQATGTYGMDTIESVAFEGLDKLHWSQERGYQSIETIVGIEHDSLDHFFDSIFCSDCNGGIIVLPPPTDPGGGTGTGTGGGVCDLDFSPLPPECLL